MLKVFQRLIVAALCLPAFVLTSELLTQIWPGVRLVSSAYGQDVGPRKMVLISPDLHRDPVKVIQITENGEPIIPGMHQIPEIRGKRFAAGDDWIRNLSFVLKNFTSMNIVWVQLVIVFAPGDGDIGRDQADWFLGLGRVPDAAAATFKSPRYIPKGKSTGPFLLGAGQETAISLSNYADEIRASIESHKMPFSSAAKCAIGIDNVYFEDQGDLRALKWQNYGYGYALPGPEGYYRLDPDYFPGDLSQTTGAR